MKILKVIIAGLFLSTCYTSPALAQQSVCGDRDEIVSRLETGYQELTSGMGLASNGGLVELYTSKKGTWTLMVTQPSGVSCLIGAGDHWETIEPKEIIEGDLS